MVAIASPSGRPRPLDIVFAVTDSDESGDEQPTSGCVALGAPRAPRRSPLPPCRRASPRAPLALLRRAAATARKQKAFPSLRISTAGDDDDPDADQRTLDGERLRQRTVSITPSAYGDDDDDDERLPWLGVKPEDIRMLEVIGRGASGQVRRVLHGPSGSVLAVKEIDIQDTERRKQVRARAAAVAAAAASSSDLAAGRPVQRLIAPHRAPARRVPRRCTRS